MSKFTSRMSGATKRLASRSAVGLLLGLLAATFAAGTAQAATVTCKDQVLPLNRVRTGGGTAAGQQDDLLVTGKCSVNKAGTYSFGQVNIVSGGALIFTEPLKDTGTEVNFWASSIIVENDGALVAGGETKPYGQSGGVLNIYIYGKDLSEGQDPAKNPGMGALCKSATNAATGPCGIPLALWNDNGANVKCIRAPLLLLKDCKGVTDYFYQYGPNFGDELCSDGKTKWSNGRCPGTTQVGYFGYKVLAVSYGGTLQLFGYKGTPLLSDLDQAECAQGLRSLPSRELLPTNTGCSWLRLAKDLPPALGVVSGNPNQLTLSARTGDRWWSAKDANNGTPDQAVVTTTDYLPRHSELLTIAKSSGATLSFNDAIVWRHRGTKYTIKDKLGASATAVRTRMIGAGMDADTIDNGAETRAAVALLTRSIRIISGGDTAGQTFEDAGKVQANCKTFKVTVPGKSDIKQIVPNCYYFGAHTIFRQGFESVQIQGVEFKDMGQGGKLGHYPIHFHMARQVPGDTFIKDSSINESMTRWIVVHSTQGVLLQRNVGWKSIGHGFFLEDGTEVDNSFYSNIGIFARAAIDNDSNNRKVPGILAAAWAGKNNTGGAVTLAPEAFPFRSDYDHPAVFWIANGWNDFIGNMAAGAGACGMAYWFVPAWNSDMPDVPTAGNVFPKGTMHMKWFVPIPPNFTTRLSGYAGVQFRDGNSAMTPFKSFYKNYSTSTMGSFSDVGDMAFCPGVIPPIAHGLSPNPSVLGIPSFAPIPISPPDEKDPYYPHIAGGGHQTTRCPLVKGTTDKYDCSQFTGSESSNPSNSKCNNKGALPNCGVVALDHYTSSFHWAQTNFAAIWSRPQWFLLTNNFLSDVQNGGVTSFTSGDYSRGAVIEGDWALARTTVFVGNTQNGNAFAANSGPFSNGLTGALKCDLGVASPKAYCLSAVEGISMPLDNFGVNQRLFNIYDGPMYEESNMFLDITQTLCPNCMYANTPGVRKEIPDKNVPTKFTCYLPNAAIAWKQPNGFFYPPSFHSDNLFFNEPRTEGDVKVGGVDIRHYVIDALFKTNTYLQDTNGTEGLTNAYCKPVGDASFSTNFFEGFTDIDRQTELNDDDGSLTGLTNDAKTGTISVNPVEFFNAPLQTAECLSNPGVTPGLACPDGKGNLRPTPTPTTAITSPYDYVTTVVYPQCGVGQGSGLGQCGSSPPPDKSLNDDGKHFLSIEGRGGTWSKECSNPACYGVPLYRQFLTGSGKSAADATREAKTWFANGCNVDKTQAKCRWPFVRMGGQSTFNRSSLTVNHGTYFLDTSVTLEQQKTEAFSNTIPCPPGVTKDSPACAPRSFNVFVKGQTFYLFFLFAKPETRQTYQIYVGPGFKDGDISAVRADLTSRPVNAIINVAAWPTAWTKDYNNEAACGKGKEGCGILQVTIDMKDQTDLDPKPKNGLCLPGTFCHATGDDCGANEAMETDPSVLANSQLFGEIGRTCKVWAVRDLDFPPLGPLGFSFKMPNDPDGKSLEHRPVPTFFPTTPDTGKPDWLTEFTKTVTVPDKATGGDCFYEQLLTNKKPLPSGHCPMPTTAEGGVD